MTSSKLFTFICSKEKNLRCRIRHGWFCVHFHFNLIGKMINSSYHPNAPLILTIFVGKYKFLSKLWVKVKVCPTIPHIQYTNKYIERILSLQIQFNFNWLYYEWGFDLSVQIIGSFFVSHNTQTNISIFYSVDFAYSIYEVCCLYLTWMLFVQDIFIYGHFINRTVPLFVFTN